jgi:hypothetical protein
MKYKCIIEKASKDGGKSAKNVTLARQTKEEATVAFGG